MAHIAKTDVKMPAGFSLQAFDILGSTNDEAMRQALNGAPNGLVIWAKTQSGGRGRRGREWVSLDGNLFLSVYVRRRCDLFRLAQLSIVSAIAMREAIEIAYDLKNKVAHKWPNDLLVDGRKISGILLEAVNLQGLDNGVIIGTGVNMVHAPDNTLYPTASLSDFSTKSPTLEAMIGFYLERLAYHLDLWDREGFALMRLRFLEHAQGLGEKVTARLANGDEKVGIFSDIDKDGILQLTLPSGELYAVAAGDIFFE